MYNEKMINDALVYAYRAGYNIVFIQVRGRGYSYYNSDIVPKHPKIDPDFDPLYYAVTLGQALGIEIHAWMNSYILWSLKSPPANIDHLFYTHKEWTETNMHGKSDAQIKLAELQSPQWEGIYLAPTHPEVNPYLLSVISEVFEKYDVNGIHLDYIRFQDEIYGYNKEGMKVFDEIYVLTSGGPGTTTQVISMYIYSVFSEETRFGYASFLSLVVGILMTIFVYIYLKINNKYK